MNAPVQHVDKRGWLNIDHWDSLKDNLFFDRSGGTVRIKLPFLTLSYTGVGIEGGCPAEKDNDGCFYLSESEVFREAETISNNKEYCDCDFAWHFHENDAHGVSIGKTLPAFYEDTKTEYEKSAFTAENAAAIPCRQVLGSYIVRFER